MARRGGRVLRRLLVGTWAGGQVIGCGSAVSRVNALTRSLAQHWPSAAKQTSTAAIMPDEDRQHLDVY